MRPFKNDKTDYLVKALAAQIESKAAMIAAGYTAIAEQDEMVINAIQAELELRGVAA